MADGLLGCGIVIVCEELRGPGNGFFRGALALDDGEADRFGIFDASQALETGHNDQRQVGVEAFTEERRSAWVAEGAEEYDRCLPVGVEEFAFALEIAGSSPGLEGGVEFLWFPFGARQVEGWCAGLDDGLGLGVEVIPVDASAEAEADEAKGDAYFERRVFGAEELCFEEGDGFREAGAGGLLDDVRFEVALAKFFEGAGDAGQDSVGGCGCGGVFEVEQGVGDQLLLFADCRWEQPCDDRDGRLVMRVGEASSGEVAYLAVAAGEGGAQNGEKAWVIEEGGFVEVVVDGAQAGFFGGEIGDAVLGGPLPEGGGGEGQAGVEGGELGSVDGEGLGREIEEVTPVEGVLGFVADELEGDRRFCAVVFGLEEEGLENDGGFAGFGLFELGGGEGPKRPVVRAWMVCSRCMVWISGAACWADVAEGARARRRSGRVIWWMRMGLGLVRGWAGWGVWSRVCGPQRQGQSPYNDDCEGSCNCNCKSQCGVLRFAQEYAPRSGARAAATAAETCESWLRQHEKAGRVGGGLEGGLEAGARVEVVAEGVAEEVEGEDGEHDGEGRKDDHVRGVKEVGAGFIQHGAPGRGGSAGCQDPGTIRWPLQGRRRPCRSAA